MTDKTVKLSRKEYFMIVLEFTKDKNELSFIEEQINEYPEIEILEVDSLGLETVIQVVIPVMAILAPVISTILQKILDNKRVTIKYKDIEISAGSYEEAKKIMDDIMEKENEN